MFEVDDLVVIMSAMNRTGFDFVGRFVGMTNDCIYLKNPLVIDYGEGSTIRQLAPLHMPMGMVKIPGKDSVLAMPMDGVGYAFTAPEGLLPERYAAFFTVSKLADME